MRRETSAIGLQGVVAIQPPNWRGLDELEADGLLTSAPETLAGFGFTGAHVCESAGLRELALEASQRALIDAGVEAHDIDAVIWASARTGNHIVGSDGASSSRTSTLLSEFRYAGPWLQDALDSRNAAVMAVAQQGCSTMFSALRLGRSLIVAEPHRFRHVLCVGADVLPAGAPREILYNLISDGACAVVVSRGCSRDVWLGSHQISRGYLWDTPASEAAMVGSYFLVARELIQELLVHHDLRPADIDLVVPTAVNTASWQLLLRLAGIPPDRLYQRSRSIAHTMTSDNFLFLQSLRRSAAVPRGSRLLLFTFGFGATWSGLLLEH